ncbi:MAG TPA: FISUMP domain-containing protein [Candidatus Saccharibacteria bacterium]|nr:FISUMP domain-containing protein [Candidatus Saccharibacteria bacterium]HMR38254.1 FISUMP domain-containing protein [Candidatus Saccharibacteria bacterium]
MRKSRTTSFYPAFTIVELLIVVIVIAILATISIVAYNGIRQRATDSAIASKESTAKKKLETYKVENDSYPEDQATFDSLTGQKPGDKFYTTYSSSSPHGPYTLFTTGDSSGGGNNDAIANGSFMQSITTANCPTTRTMAVDARDNKTYWVQKLADGKCWMLTNLAYAGGGVNTYSDTIPTGDGSNGTLHGPDNSGSVTYALAKYYIPTGANPTTNPTQPSTSTDGGVTNPQYGYLYNFCAANGGQTGNGACSDSVSTAVNTTISICPANWRLPTQSPTNEFTLLNNAVNSGLTTTDAGLRSEWLAQRSGSWYSGGFNSQGSNGFYRSSTQYSATYGRHLSFFSSGVVMVAGSKLYGFAVRCVAS